MFLLNKVRDYMANKTNTFVQMNPSLGGTTVKIIFGYIKVFTKGVRCPFSFVLSL